MTEPPDTSLFRNEWLRNANTQSIKNGANIGWNLCIWNSAPRMMTSGPENWKPVLFLEACLLAPSLQPSQVSRRCLPITELWALCTDFWERVSAETTGSSPPIFSFCPSGDDWNGESLRKDWSGIMPCRMAILSHLIEGIWPWTQPGISLLFPVIWRGEARPLAS